MASRKKGVDCEKKNIFKFKRLIIVFELSNSQQQSGESFYFQFDCNKYQKGGIIYRMISIRISPFIAIAIKNVKK